MYTKNTIMKFVVGLFVLAGLISLGSAWADDYGKKAANTPAATQYLIEIPHTAAQCLAALDAIKAQGADKLSQWNWGCSFGDHTAYRLVNAKSEAEAMSMIPEAERSTAKLVPLTKFSVEQIESFHAMKH